MAAEGQLLDLLGEGKKDQRQEAHEGVDGGGDLLDRPGLDIDVEEAFADDAQGEEQHLGDGGRAEPGCQRSAIGGGVVWPMTSP